jgi:hypothetical protein
MMLFYPVFAFAQLKIKCDTSNESIQYGLSRMASKISLIPFHMTAVIPVDLVILSVKDEIYFESYGIRSEDFQSIKSQGFRIKKDPAHHCLVLLYIDNTGVVYGINKVNESIISGISIPHITEETSNAFLSNRIIKYNLPWSPYRNEKAITLHDSTCRDLNYWKKFLDMMVDTRFNVLSLWNIHPFPFMIKSKTFPLANNFNEAQMNAWRSFWTSLFHMAKVRGIETFIVNWNIAVSPEFAKAYHVSEYSDQSEIVKQYTRSSVTQLINEYPDLTGIGVTLADWMGTFDEKMTPQQREDWIEETFVKGMKEADRTVKFLHRSVLAGDPLAMRHLIDHANLKEPSLVEIKFNWSHGHSTPLLAITHDYHSGKLDDRFWSPKPSNYDIQWMIRNEDIFILRWGQSDFIRDHIRANTHDYVNGYFIGSEGYIPAVDYSAKIKSEQTWQYAFEKQWLFYAMWGRLLYNPSTPDTYFESLINHKYGKGSGSSLLSAYKYAGNMPLRLASFHRSTWDYTLYSEGFLEPEPSNVNGFFDRTSPFISIDEFIRHETLDPGLLSIPDFVNKTLSDSLIAKNLTTPLALADLSERDSRKALNLFSIWYKSQTNKNKTLMSEWKDIATWSNLGMYFADKLRAGVALQTFYRTGNKNSRMTAVNELKKALKHWDQVIAYTKDRYLPTPYVALGMYKDTFPLFSWEGLRDQVVRDIDIAYKAKYIIPTKEP